MKSTNSFKSYTDFYESQIAHLNTLRIDGNEKGGNRKSASTFIFNGHVWKVHQDSHIEPLKKAFEEFSNGQMPFIMTNTKGNKGKCLILNPAIYSISESKKMYIYKVRKV